MKENYLIKATEENFEIKIPDSLEVYCPICKKNVEGRYIGIEKNVDLTLIFYNCCVCDDTISVRPENLKSKLIKLVA